MARPRKFDEQQVLQKSGELFANLGFNATSVDDLIRVTGLQRGSLYQAFGSKRGLFIAAFNNATGLGWHKNETALDLMIVALKELAGRDSDVTEICLDAIAQVWDEDLIDASQVFGQRLLRNLGKDA